MIQDVVNVKIERTNSNDELVTLAEINAKDGYKVNEGDKLGSVETSKAAIDLIAPHNGTIYWCFSVGDSVKIDETVCQIFPVVNAENQFTTTVQILESVKNTSSVRKITNSALRLMEEHRIDVDRLPSTGLITEKMVRHLLLNGQDESLKASAKIASGYRTAMIKNITTANTEAVLGYVFGQVLVRSSIKESDIFDQLILRTFEVQKDFPLFKQYFRNNILESTDIFSTGLIIEDSEELNVITIKEIQDGNLQDYVLAKNQALYRHFSKEPVGLARPNVVLSHLSSERVSFHQPILFPNACATFASMSQKINGIVHLNICVAYDHRLLNGGYVVRFLDNLLSHFIML